VTPKTNRY